MQMTALTVGLLASSQISNLLAFLKGYGELIVIAIGATIGSFKANAMSKTKLSVAVKTNNIVLGIFAGFALAYNYLDSLHIWGAAITALIASSLSVAIIDSLFKIAPDIADKLVEKWLGVDMSVDEPEVKTPVDEPEVKTPVTETPEEPEAAGPETDPAKISIEQT